MDEPRVSLIIAGLALAVSAIGIWLSNRRANASEKIAREALDDARGVRRDVLWSAHIESVHGMIGLDPSAHDVREALARMRVTAGALSDGLPDWQDINRWLNAEHALGSLLLREAMARLLPPLTPDERMAALRPPTDWAMALLNNLRHFRKTGRNDTIVRELAEHAETEGSAVLARNGWPPPQPPSWQPMS